MQFLVFTLLFTLTACGTQSKDGEAAPFRYDLPEDLAAKRSIYAELAPSQQNANGFIETDHCDSLLLTGLLGAAGVSVANIHAAEESPGKWLRRDKDSGSCYPVGSGSEISRDMLLGLIWYAWAKQDLDILKDLYDYGSDNNWVMGAGDPTRTGLRTLRGTLAAAIYVLGGPRRLGDELLNDPQAITKDGYEAHLQVIHILLRGEIYGGLSAWNQTRLKELADQNPRSPIMQAAAAKWSNKDYWPRFVSSAQATNYWPADRLPTSADRCIDWATQESNPKDWAPCPDENRTHSGGDFLFAVWSITHI